MLEAMSISTGAFEVAGHTDADGVGAQLAGASAEGGDVLGSRAGVGGNQANHALGGGHGGVVAQPPDVALTVDGDGGDAVGAGLVDGHAHGALGDHEAEAPVAVDDGGAGGLALHHEGRAGDDVADVNALGVGGNLDDAVGVMAAQVGLDQVPGHRFGLGIGRALGSVDVVGDFLQIFSGKDGHSGTSGGVVVSSRKSP